MKIWVGFGIAVFFQVSCLHAENSCQRFFRVVREALSPSAPVFEVPTILTDLNFRFIHVNPRRSRARVTNAIHDLRRHLKEENLDQARQIISGFPNFGWYSYRDLERVADTLNWAFHYFPKSWNVLGGFTETHQNKLVALRSEILRTANTLSQVEWKGFPTPARGLFFGLLLDALNGGGNPMVVVKIQRDFLPEVSISDQLGFGMSGLETRKEHETPIEETFQLPKLRILAAQYLAQHPNLPELGSSALKIAEDLRKRPYLWARPLGDANSAMATYLEYIVIRIQHDPDRQDPGSPSE